MYPKPEYYKRNQKFNMTKRSWYNKPHKNKKSAGKMFYLPVSNKPVPHLY